MNKLRGVSLTTFRSYSDLRVFDRPAKMLQRNRAALSSESRTTDYLRDEISRRTAERLAFISRRFDRVLDFGSGPGSLWKILCEPDTPDGSLIRSRIGKVTMLDSAGDLLHRDSDLGFNHQVDIERVEHDEEMLLSRFGPNSFDAVISNMYMHWINDLPGVLTQINSVLVPDGLFLCAMLGGDTLFELRTSLQLAEMERLGGMSPRVSPMVQVQDVGGILQRARFNLLTVDVDDIVISYPDVFALFKDLQWMGESNVVLSRLACLNRDVLVAADPIYRAMHGEPDGLPATFRVVYMIGWKNSESQPKPLARGSGEVSLKDVLRDDA